VMPIDSLIAGVMLVTLIAYTLLAGADFGAGIWDLLARGPRRGAQRRAIAEAIGPVWEANHVWLIFLIVLLFTCFPAAFSAVSVALFWPLHLVLIGIVLRGASFVFRAYGSKAVSAQAAWGQVFGAASAFTPVLLGMSLGAISGGSIRVGAHGTSGGGAWLAPFAIATGLLALALCAYLAAVYLAWESSGDLRADFRRRALATWLAAGVASLGTLLLSRWEAPRLWEGLTSGPAAAAVVIGSGLAPLSFVALWRHRYHLARWAGGAQVVALLVGWGLAQWPYLIYPDLTIRASAAPPATLTLTAAMLPLGAGLLVPSLWLLFSVFKRRPAQFED
jgi:cytochrome bd ubiquinol oxidase subunit II